MKNSARWVNCDSGAWWISLVYLEQSPELCRRTLQVLERIPPPLPFCRHTCNRSLSDEHSSSALITDFSKSSSKHSTDLNEATRTKLVWRASRGVCEFAYNSAFLRKFLIKMQVRNYPCWNLHPQVRTYPSKSLVYCALWQKSKACAFAESWCNYSGDQSGIEMVKSSPIIYWSVIQMMIWIQEYCSPLFKWWSE